ncbi:hypothetical protein QYF61_019536 [Mycteria americana]|uniref:Uncharacterized protein n=1 Tax=Mycteria americana TaxID=33587 RepID=A0AAN7SFE6_MYCAM|nr:hypothetical protein QYF61_019536 [Mycteria americana]
MAAERGAGLRIFRDVSTRHPGHAPPPSSKGSNCERLGRGVRGLMWRYLRDSSRDGRARQRATSSKTGPVRLRIAPGGLVLCPPADGRAGPGGLCRLSSRDAPPGSPSRALHETGAWLLQVYSLMKVETNDSEPSGMLAWLWAAERMCQDNNHPVRHELPLLLREDGMPWHLKLPLALFSVEIAIQLNLEGGESDPQPAPPEGGPLSCLSRLYKFRTDDGKLSFDEFKAYFADGVLSGEELHELFHTIDTHNTENFTKFNKEKCKFLPLGRNSPMHHYLLGATQLESSLAEKDMGWTPS